MERSTEEKKSEDVPLTNILPTITGVVRSRSESSINDDDSIHHPYSTYHFVTLNYTKFHSIRKP